MIFFKTPACFSKEILIDVSLDCSAKTTPSCDCSVIATLLSGKTEADRQDCKKHFFLAPNSQGRSSVPSSALLCAGNLVNIRSTQKLSCISLFHARGHRMPSFWVTGTTRFESADIICQIWPIRGYIRSWYTGAGCLKKWLQAPPPLLSPVSSRFTFVLALSQFSGPNYLEAWNRLVHFKLLNQRLLWDKRAWFYCLLNYDLSLQKSTSTLRIVKTRRYCFYHESKMGMTPQRQARTLN